MTGYLRRVVVGKDDETRTAANTSSDPALDATVRATPPADASSTLGERLEPQIGEVIGRYHLLEVLGRGGMGVVFRARDPELDRELAIKIVRPGGHSVRAHERLLAEARAMAKLRHPAVVPVFDVGTTQQGVFIVMPLISGGTMHEWMREEHSWRDVVDRFVAAGRGLAAAHAAGFVHRDFKPRNVLISDRGDVLVADFGIVARTDDSIDPDAETSTPGSAQVSSIAGTPAYMAPEQAEGGPIDARADQYAFCITFWEALCGQRPTEAETRTHTSALMPAGAREGARQRVPSWLLKAVARGFSAAPSHRWPSMDSLLGHIEAHLRRPRRIATAFAAVGFVGIAASAVFLARGTREDPCPSPNRRLAGIWTPAVREAVQRAFLATGAPYAQDSLDRVLPVLDRYANGWSSGRIEACRESVIERSQSAELYDRRVLCLDGRLDLLRTRTALLSTVDRETLPRAVELVESLPPLSDCSDATALLSAYPTPTDASARARIMELEGRIRDLDAFAIRGAPKDVLERATALANEARTLNHPPTLVLALRTLSEAERQNGVSAEATQRELVEAAAQAHDDVALASGWSRLVLDLARKRQFKEARALEPVAEAALTRAGAPQSLVFRVNSDLAARAYEEDEYDVAITRQRKALEAASTSIERRNALTDLAGSLRASARGEEALALVEEAVKLAKDTHGEEHPVVASTLVLLAMTLQSSGKPDDLPKASAAMDRALAIREKAFGSESQPVAETLSVMGSTLTVQGQYREAGEALRKAIAIMEPRGDSPLLGKLYRRLGDTVTYLEDFDRARPHYERALKILQMTVGAASMEYAVAALNYAVELSDRGECTAALPYAEGARAFLEPQGHPFVASVFLTLGKCELASGRNADGIAWIEKSLSTCSSAKCTTGYVEDVRYYLGTKLVETDTDRKRGLALVRESRKGFEAIGRTEVLPIIDDFLRKHR